MTDLNVQTFFDWLFGKKSLDKAAGQGEQTPSKQTQGDNPEYINIDKGKYSPEDSIPGGTKPIIPSPKPSPLPKPKPPEPVKPAVKKLAKETYY